MAAETVGVLEQAVGKPAHLVGFCDGGIVAMLVALRRPELVRRLVLIGANFHVDGLQPLEFGDHAPLWAAIGESYAERSPDGHEHFGVVAAKSLAVFTGEPTMTTADVGRIPAPTLVVVGDDDAVALSHTCTLYESLPRVSWPSSPARRISSCWRRPPTSLGPSTTSSSAPNRPLG